MPMTAVGQALAAVWGLLVWANWYRWNATGPDADWIGFCRGAIELIPFLSPGAIVVAWIRHLGSFALLALLVLAAMGAGRIAFALLGVFRRSVRGFIERIALGAAVDGFLTMGLGFAGLSFESVAWLGTVIFGIIGFGTVRSAWAGNEGIRLWQPGIGWAVGLLAAAILIPICGAVAPETSIDAQLHHLAQPAVFASLHKIVAFPWNEFSWHPALAHMSFLHGMQVGGPGLAKLVAFGWFLLIVVFVTDWAREYVGVRWALLTGAGFALLPYMQLLAMRAYPDFATIGYTAIMMRGLTPSSGVRLTGLWAGLAAATKLTGLLAPAVGVIGLVMGLAGPGAWIWSAVLSLLVVSPWMLRNLLASGNPVAPLLPAVFPTLSWDPASVERHLRDLTPASAEPMALPGVFAALERVWNVGIRNTGVLDPMAGIGGWFLWLIPLLVLFRHRRFRLGWLVVSGVVVWNFMPRLVRYSMPVWPAAAVACAVALRSVMADRSGRIFGVVALSLLVFHLPLGIARQHHVANPVAVACGAESPDRYRARGFPEGLRTLEVRDWIRLNAGSARVLMLTPTGLWLTYGSSMIFQTLFDTPVIVRLASTSRSADEIGKRLRQLHVEYTLYQPAGGYSLQRKYGTWGFDEVPGSAWRAFWAARAVRVFASGDRFVIHRITNGAPAVPDGTLPGLDEQWLGRDDAGDPAVLEGIARLRNTAVAWEQVGISRLNHGDEAGALAAFKSARAQGARTVATLASVGMLSARRSHWTEAEAALREALAVDPSRADVRATLAQVESAKGRR